MRKLFAFNMISLDGFFEGPNHDITWHTVDDEFNQFAIEQTNTKVVFSRTLQKVEWHNTRLITHNVAEEILKMKQEPGNDLAVFGSANLLSSLMQMNLVDEHRVMVNPVLIAGGTPLFNNLAHKVSLKLIQARTFRSGNVLLYYQPNTQ